MIENQQSMMNSLESITSRPHTIFHLHQSPRALTKSTHYDISSSSLSPSSTIYHFETHQWKKNNPNPDVIMRLGKDKDGMMIGTASFRYSRSVILNINTGGAATQTLDDEDEDDAQSTKHLITPNQADQDVQRGSQLNLNSIEMKPLGNILQDGSYHLELPLTSSSDVSGRQFKLKRTQSKEDGVGGWRGKVGWNNWKVTEVGGTGEEGAVVGMYVGKANWSGKSEGDLSSEKRGLGIVVQVRGCLAGVARIRVMWRSSGFCWRLLRCWRRLSAITVSTPLSRDEILRLLTCLFVHIETAAAV